MCSISIFAAHSLVFVFCEQDYRLNQSKLKCHGQKTYFHAGKLYPFCWGNSPWSNEVALPYKHLPHHPQNNIDHPVEIARNVSFYHEEQHISVSSITITDVSDGYRWIRLIISITPTKWRRPTFDPLLTDISPRIMVEIIVLRETMVMMDDKK